MVERQARDLEVRGSNPGPGSNLSLEFKFKCTYDDNVQHVGKTKAGTRADTFFLPLESLTWMLAQSAVTATLDGAPACLGLTAVQWVTPSSGIKVRPIFKSHTFLNGRTFYCNDNWKFPAWDCVSPPLTVHSFSEGGDVFIWQT